MCIADDKEELTEEEMEDEWSREDYYAQWDLDEEGQPKYVP